LSCGQRVEISGLIQNDVSENTPKKKKTEELKRRGEQGGEYGLKLMEVICYGDEKERRAIKFVVDSFNDALMKRTGGSFRKRTAR
jgi:hypothetical protein